MSASAERIYLQIVELESRLQEDRAAGRDTILLEEQITFLRKELNSLTETLSSPNFVLKG